MKKNYWLSYTILIMFMVILLYPFYYLVLNSFRSIYDAPVPLMVTRWAIKENYTYAVTLIDYLRYFRNSMIFIGIGVPMSIVINLCLAYAFARLKAPGKNFFFSVCLATLMIPGIALMLPQYIFLAETLGLKDSWWLLVIRGIGGSAYLVFFVRQFFSTIPHSIEEAARIDGCSIFGTLIRIFVPLSIPVIALVTFFTTQFIWGDYFTPFLYFKEAKRPLATALFGVSYTIPGQINLNLEPVILAASLMFMIPIVLAFFATQKYLVEGIATKGLKG